jgi:hypothetical protein
MLVEACLRTEIGITTWLMTWPRLGLSVSIQQFVLGGSGLAGLHDIRVTDTTYFQDLAPTRCH